MVLRLSLCRRQRKRERFPDGELKGMYKVAGLLKSLALLACLLVFGCSGHYKDYRSDYRSLLSEIDSYARNVGPFSGRSSSLEEDKNLRVERIAGEFAIRDKIVQFKKTYRDEFRNYESYRGLDVQGEADKYGMDIDYLISHLETAKASDDSYLSGNGAPGQTLQSGTASGELQAKVKAVEKLLDQDK